MNIGLQAYVKNSIEAVEFYKKAFSATLGYHAKNEDGTFLHAEIVLNGEIIISLSESFQWLEQGMNMQFCINFGKDNKQSLERAYEILKKDGQVRYPLGPCDWNECIADLTDKFGIRWYIAL